MLTPDEIIRTLELKPLPIEGGFYRQTYRSHEQLGDGRALATAIYYLLTPDTRSTIHRLKGDEVYHFYLGDAVEMILLYEDGSSELVELGPNILEGQKLQYVVPAGVWQGARLIKGGRWALLGTTMAPGFDWNDYEQGERERLIRLYPARRRLIEELSRPG